MPVDLYYSPASCPSRAVQLLAKVLGIKLNLKCLDLGKGEQQMPEFLTINPQHTVPTIVDDGFILWKSHAILCYFASKYAKDDSLYPKDLQERAQVDKMLYFGTENVFGPLRNFIVKQFYLNQPADSELFQQILSGLDTFEKFLANSKYAAGDHLTIADFSLAMDVCNITCLKNINLESYPNMKIWMEKLKVEIAHFDEINDPGVEHFSQLLSAIEKKNAQ